MSVSQQLIVPKLEGLVLRYRVTQDGGNKLPAKIYDYNFLLLACLQVGESTMGNKDGFRLERTCVGVQENWRISR
jgi:hypothetical protein